MPRSRPFTLLPARERDEISLVRSRPSTVRSCDHCGTLTTSEVLCPDCSELLARQDTERCERWK